MNPVWAWIFSAWPQWMREAACADADPELFFPEHNRDRRVRKAKSYCERCPVITQCLEFALTQHDYGIWGGKTEEERQKIKEHIREFSS